MRLHYFYVNIGGYISLLFELTFCENANFTCSLYVVRIFIIISLVLGKMLIINNIKFIDNKDEREGSKKDAEDLKKLFKKLGFEVETKENLKGKVNKK